jgi:hypothetical protein
VPLLQVRESRAAGGVRQDRETARGLRMRIR